MAIIDLNNLGGISGSSYVVNTSPPGYWEGGNTPGAPTALTNPNQYVPQQNYTDQLGNSYGGNAAAAAAANAKIDQARLAQRGIVSRGQQEVNTLEQQYQDKTLPFARTVEQGQQNINEGQVNNALNLRRTGQQIGRGIGQGVRSLGVSLANRNAASSGAAVAGAQAYAKQGGQQLNQARNQATLKSQDLAVTQKNLGQQKEDTLASLQRFKVTEADRIYRSAMQSLAELNSQTGVAGAVDTHGQDAIVNDALHRLDLLDAALKTRLDAAKALTPEEIAAQSVQRDVAGAAANPFEYDPTNVVVPGGPPQTQLPFILAKPRDEQGNTLTQPLAIA